MPFGHKKPKQLIPLKSISHPALRDNSKVNILPSHVVPFRRHVADWHNCQHCKLCNNRKHVVLFRGTMPCDVLFIGEAPGDSEDMFGFPFIGPAGEEFNSLLFEAYSNTSMQRGMTLEMSRKGYIGNARGQLLYGVTNIVACLPLTPPPMEEGVQLGTGTIRPPTKGEAEACSQRLKHCILLCQPKLIVTLGQEAKRYLPLALAEIKSWPGTPPKQLNLPHPSHILRQRDESPSHAELAAKKFVVQLAEALEKL